MDISPSYELPWLSLESCLTSILSHPTVGSKEHLVRHTDRVSGGRVAQQPGVGPLTCRWRTTPSLPTVRSGPGPVGLLPCPIVPGIE